MREGGGGRERERRRKVGKERGGRDTRGEETIYKHSISVAVDLHPAGLSSGRVS